MSEQFGLQNPKMRVRKAELKDLDCVVDCVFEAGEHFWRAAYRSFDDEKLKIMIRHYAQVKGSIIDINCCDVAVDKETDEALAALLHFPAKELKAREKALQKDMRVVIKTMGFLKFLRILLTVAGFSSPSDNIKRPEKDDYYIMIFACSPKHQGRGAGSFLIQYARKVAEASGHPACTLHVEDYHQHAMYLYRKIGLEVDFEVDQSKKWSKYEIGKVYRMRCELENNQAAPGA
eukprot:Clim_evm7s16 gene=Clim_evmTU7s16